jgi:hypothetical protein
MITHHFRVYEVNNKPNCFETSGLGLLNIFNCNMF